MHYVHELCYEASNHNLIINRHDKIPFTIYRTWNFVVTIYFLQKSCGYQISAMVNLVFDFFWVWYFDKPGILMRVFSFFPLKIGILKFRPLERARI